MRIHILSGLSTFVGALILTGCAAGDMQSKNVQTYFKTNQSLIREQYHQLLTAKNYKWILHVHFRGNDFGLLTGKEIHAKLGPVLKDHPLQTLELRKDEAALELQFDYSHPQILGTLKYRSGSGDRALKAISHLFNCGAGKSERLDEVLLVLSGGSHGAHEAQGFAKNLEDSCGKSVDVVIMGDAIAQPMSVPMSHFANIPESVPCLNFFQQNPIQFIRGQPLSNCLNVKISGTGHYGLQQAGMFFMSEFFNNISQGTEPVLSSELN